jgi:hypothetical protein
MSQALDEERAARRLVERRTDELVAAARAHLDVAHRNGGPTLAEALRAYDDARALLRACEAAPR